MAGFGTAVVSVPTPLREGAPDLSYVESAARKLSPYVRQESCVILESTTYPGTTEMVFAPLLEGGSGLRAGHDFGVGYSPERIDPGNGAWTLRNTPKIVAGVNEYSLKMAVSFFERIVDTVVTVGTVREAELAKLFENTFRHVNIALVNEMAICCNGLGLNIWSVLDAAATKPFGFMKFVPGPGVGGHCLPIDPSYLSWQVRQTIGRTFRFIEVANDINDHMPEYVAERVAEHLNDQCRSVKGSEVLVIGLAYKRNSGDIRESPPLEVVSKLVSRGARIRAVDPFVPSSRIPSHIEMV